MWQGRRLVELAVEVVEQLADGLDVVLVRAADREIGAVWIGHESESTGPGASAPASAAGGDGVLM
jgi:hypothetical protein